MEFLFRFEFQYRNLKAHCRKWQTAECFTTPIVNIHNGKFVIMEQSNRDTSSIVLLTHSDKDIRLIQKTKDLIVMSSV